MVKKFQDFSPLTISFLQSALLVIYIFLVSLLFWKGDAWFGPLTSPLGPMLFLLLFVLSAIISSTLLLGYPGWLFFVEKTQREAIKIICLSVGWLLGFLLLLFLLLMLIH